MLTIAIFFCREDFATLTKIVNHTIDSLKNAGISFEIDAIINGNEQLSAELSKFKHKFSLVNFYSIQTADKGNAWNEHIHNVWRGTGHVLYIDGYVLIDAISVQKMLCTAEKEDVLGTSGMPSTGLGSALLRRTMKATGGFHGNCCMLTDRALAIIKRKGIRLPRRMYRVDGLMGAFLSFGLNPTEVAWSPERFIPITIDASWSLHKTLSTRLAIFKLWWHRKFRQAKGDFENKAITFYLRDLHCNLEKLPEDIFSMIEHWMKIKNEEYLLLARKSFFHREAIKTFDFQKPAGPVHSFQHEIQKI